MAAKKGSKKSATRAARAAKVSPQGDSYKRRGVSSDKEAVIVATKQVSRGLYPGAFCRIGSDIAGDPKYVRIFHSDGVGTKVALGWLAWKLLGDPKFLSGLAQDSVVMNIDDMACCGATGPFIMSDVIGRNPFQVPDDVLPHLINGFVEFLERMTALGIACELDSGETADTPDLSRTFDMNASVFARLHRKDIIDCGRMSPGDILVGFSSTGRANYEKVENSGMGSNGLTSARHDLLRPYYRRYTASFSPEMPRGDVYKGPYWLDDTLPGTNMMIAEAMLSPTRTYVPLIKELIQKLGVDEISGIIHNSGGGQKKIKNFGAYGEGKGNVYIMNNIFPVPPLFKAIREASGDSWEAMYRRYNMGWRLTVAFRGMTGARQAIAISKSFGIEAKKIGFVTLGDPGKNTVVITGPDGVQFTY